MATHKPTHPKLSLLAGLPVDVTITNIVKHEHCDELYVSFSTPQQRSCPHCGSNDCVIKGPKRKQTVRHIPHAQRGTIVTLFKQRFLCKACCATFYEQPQWLHPSLHMTQALFTTLVLDLTQMLSITMIARQNKVTPNIVTSVFNTIVWEQPKQLPETLCIDEFKGSSGEWNPQRSRWDVNKFHCNIADGDSGSIIEALQKITAEYLKSYFCQYTPYQRERVKYYCCDMHNGFVSVAKELFPKAHICIDMFHVVKLINDSIDTIRRRLQRDMEEQHDRMKYNLLKHAKRSLLTSEIKQMERHNPNDSKRLMHLRVIFNIFPELEKAYGLLQEFHYIVNEPFLFAQKANLSSWIIDCNNTNIPELTKLANSIRRWRGYIQNTWEHNRSNSTCEGLNNKIKVLKRISYGLHSFETFRKRVLLTCGGMQLSYEPFTIIGEKRNGKGGRFHA